MLTEKEVNALQVGDQVLIVATVDKVGLDRDGELMVKNCRGGDVGPTAYIHWTAIKEVIARPLAVGDTVAVSSGVEVGTIIAINGDIAWVRGDARQTDRFYYLSNLSRVSD